MLRSLSGRTTRRRSISIGCRSGSVRSRSVVLAGSLEATALLTAEAVSVTVTVTVTAPVVTIAIEAGATLLTLTRREVSAARESGSCVSGHEADSECGTECNDSTRDCRAYLEGLAVTSGLLAHFALHLVLDVRRGNVFGGTVLLDCHVVSLPFDCRCHKNDNRARSLTNAMNELSGA